MDYELYRNSKDLNPYDIPRTKDGKVSGGGGGGAAAAAAA